MRTAGEGWLCCPGVHGGRVVQVCMVVVRATAGCRRGPVLDGPQRPAFEQPLRPGHDDDDDDDDDPGTLCGGADLSVDW